MGTPREAGANNTFIASYDATGVVIAYTRKASAFRINKYVKSFNVSKTLGYYGPVLDADEPYRIVSENDYLWADGADAPGGKDQGMEFQYASYSTIRRAFPYEIGHLAVEQASWQILASYAAKSVAKAMTLRTVKAIGILTTAGNWSGNTSAASGAWSLSTESDLFIQADLNTALIAIEQKTGGIAFDEDSLRLVINSNTARKISKTDEYRNYIKGSPDALSSLTDHKNPNRRYGLAPWLYGIELVVENAMRVTSRKGGTQVRSYICPDNCAIITSAPEGMGLADNADGTDFSTIAFRFKEEMTVESKSDPDNRRDLGRVVENYDVNMQAPATGYLITGIA